MIINSGNLTTVFTAFNAAFTKGLESAKSHYREIAMTVPSTTREEEYGWMGKIPKVREWLGPRVVHGLSTHSYAIINKDFENTISVSRNDIEDDRYGVYAPALTEMGRVVAEHPDELVFDLLANGFTELCYDGQPFFDADHPVVTPGNEVVSVSNVQAGSETPWFLFDTSRAIKPMLYQERVPHTFTALTKDSDENVFFNNEFIYGTRGRSNVGFGLWQMAYASKAGLTKDNYRDARAAMMSQSGDEGRKLGMMPNLLVAPTSLEEAALEILNAERNEAGATNVWQGTAKLVLVPWL